MMSCRPDFVTKNCNKLPDTRAKQGALKEELSRLGIRAESFLPRAVKIYNHMPNELKQLGLVVFKKEVTKWIKHVTFQSPR